MLRSLRHTAASDMGHMALTVGLQQVATTVQASVAMFRQGHSRFPVPVDSSVHSLYRQNILEGTVANTVATTPACCAVDSHSQNMPFYSLAQAWSGCYRRAGLEPLLSLRAAMLRLTPPALFDRTEHLRYLFSTTSRWNSNKQMPFQRTVLVM